MQDPDLTKSKGSIREGQRRANRPFEDRSKSRPIELNPFDRERDMTNTKFRMLERLQRLDALLRIAQRRKQIDPVELFSLHLAKSTIRDGLSRLSAPTQPA